MSPIGIVVASHCDFAKAIIASAEMIAGAQENVTAVCLSLDDNLESCREAIQAAIRQVDLGRGVLVLIDLFGGTPCNAAALSLRDYCCPVVAGVNLPMLIEVVTSRDSVASVEELAALAVTAGRASILDVGARLKDRESA
jgi:mannose/fructose/sorbose-specific phosphotransferase system IIA component